MKILIYLIYYFAQKKGGANAPLKWIFWPMRTSHDSLWATVRVSCLAPHIIPSFIMGSLLRLELSHPVFEDNFRHAP